MNPDQGLLFKELDGARYGSHRLHKNLFIPKLLTKETDYKTSLRGDEQENAFEIFQKWIDLENSGKLEKMKETALQGEFLTDIFGNALGYTLFSENKKSWELEPQLKVNGGIADAGLGYFTSDEKSASVVIELKGPTVNLDKDRFAGRTAINQCWHYLDMLPECQWGIVCNYVSFRLYHRTHTPNAFQLFLLRDLKDKDKFREFYYLFERNGLLAVKGQEARGLRLVKETDDRQQEVGDELYQSYAQNRSKLIGHLKGKPHNKSLEKAIYIAQRIIDRIIFIAFCEDRYLLPNDTIKKAFSLEAPFSKVPNPKWNNFLNLFESIDRGHKKSKIPPYNGGLFRKDDEVDNLNLDDSWTNFFYSVSKFDFRDEVNVEVLGHLFERSINDIERIKKGGFFDEAIEADKPKMQKSAERKKFGIYYTPPEFTKFIVEKTIGPVIEDRKSDLQKNLKINLDDLSETPNKETLAFWMKYLVELKKIKIVDPACGSGAFLIAAYDFLEDIYNEVIYNIEFHEGKQRVDLIDEISDFILNDNLHGADLSFQAVEISQLSLWIRSAQKGKPLSDLSKNIICGNSLVDDAEIHPDAFNWEKQFPNIFKGKNPGFDCVIGNPPWERIKVQEREFFDIVSPDIAAAVNASKRKNLIEKLKTKNPELYSKYELAKKDAEKALTYIRQSGKYPLTGKGDINTYAVFAELAYKIVSSNGRVGILVPSGIATDNTTKAYFEQLIESESLIGYYDFENKAPIFHDVHRSFKFCILLFGGESIKSKKKDFVFFAHSINDLFDKKLQIVMSSQDIKLLNPNTKTCPIFRNQHDAEITKTIYKKIPILIDKNRKKGGNPWGIKFIRMFDQTNDAGLFKTIDQLKKMKYKRVGADWCKGKKTYLPLYEAKMIQMYDHRAASIEIKEENWFRQGQTIQSSQVEHQNLEYFIEPRWWGLQKDIIDRINGKEISALLAFKNVTSPTNLRTMIASFIPMAGVINSAPLILFAEIINTRYQCCLLANLNSFILDFVVRQKVGNVNLNFFIIEQLPVLTPDYYDKNCPWDKKVTLEKWISERVLKLTCTSNDMIPLAEATDFKPKVWKWKPDERAELMAELDAAYFILYGIKRDDVEYILSTFSGTQSVDTDFFDKVSITNRILKYYDKFSNKN